MKSKYLVLFFSLLFSISIAQNNERSMPSVNVKTLEGKTFNTSSITNDGKPIVMSFWATWCSPCKAELNSISEVYSDWQKETGVKVIAISIDDARNTDKVAPYVNGKNWEFEVYLDPNGDFKRAMNVNTVPHTFLINNKGEIVWQQNASQPGDEEKIYELVKKLAKGEPIN